jgi:hypothetical protein
MQRVEDAPAQILVGQINPKSQQTQAILQHSPLLLSPTQQHPRDLEDTERQQEWRKQQQSLAALQQHSMFLQSHAGEKRRTREKAQDNQESTKALVE